MANIKTALAQILPNFAYEARETSPQRVGHRWQHHRPRSVEVNGFSMVGVLVSASLMASTGAAISTMLVSQYKHQANIELKADANHGLEIAFLKWELGEPPETVGNCDLTYFDVDPTVLEITADCAKGTASTQLTRAFERTI